jgi:hypothetical protein
LNNYFVYSSGNGASPITSGAKFYDMGLFQLACANMAASGIIGELYVEYSFTMIRPKQQTPSGQNLLYAHVTELASATATAAAPLGTSGGALRGGSTIPVVTTNTTFSLPTAGTYVVSGSWVGAAIAAAPTFGLGSNIAALTLLQDNASATGHAFNAAGTAALNLEILTVSQSGTGANNLVTVGGLTSMTGGTCDIFIAQVSGGVLKESTLPSLLREKRSSQAEHRLEQMYAKLVELGVILEDDSPVSVSPGDGCVRAFEPAPSSLGQSTSAPPPTAARSSLFKLLNVNV